MTAYATSMNQTDALFANLKRTVAPVLLPVSLDLAKDHLRVTHNDEDTLIQAYLKSATTKVENDTRRGFITQTWAQYLDDFCDDLILLRRCPVIAVSSITYVDTNGTTQTVTSSDYQVDVASEPARVYPAYGVVWPTVRSRRLNAVTVTFTVGYGDTPTFTDPNFQLAQQAILLLATNFYRMRCPVSETSVVPAPLSYEALIEALRWD